MLMMATTGVNLGLGALFWFVAARRFSTAEVGIASAVIAGLSLASAVGSTGIGNALIQELPLATDDSAWRRTLNAGLLAGVAATALASAVLVLVMPEISDDLAPVRGDLWLTALFLCGAIATVLGDLSDRAFLSARTALAMLERNALAGTAKIVVLTSSVAAIAAWQRIVVAWVAALVVALAAVALLLRRINAGWTPSLEGAPRQALALRRAIGAHHLVSLGNMAPQFVLPLLVTGLLSAADNGVFFTTWRVAGVFLVISVAVSTTLFAEGSNDRANLPRALRRSMLLIAALLLPAIVLVVVVGERVLGLFGEAYEAGASLLLVLAIAAIPDALTNLGIAVLRLERRFRLASAITLGMAAITLGLAAVLVTSLGIVGVGVAWLVAQTAGVVALVLAHLRHGRLAIDNPPPTVG